MIMSKFVKILIAVFSVVFLNSIIVYADVILEWDENDPVPDGYRVFQRWEGETYDYTNHAWIGIEHPVTIPLEVDLPGVPTPENLSGEWDKNSSQITLTWEQSDNLVNTRKTFFVVRAFMREDPEDTTPITDLTFEQVGLESADSEEVFTNQINENSVSEWEVFYAENTGGSYTSLGRTQTSNLITAPITIVPEGTSKRLYFTVVAFGEEDTFSENSVEISVLIDRRITPQIPTGITIIAVVPVE